MTHWLWEDKTRFSHNAGYWCATTDMLFWLRFIHCAIVSPFIFHWFSFSLTGEWKGQKSLKKFQCIVMACTYYITQMAKCTCTWLHHPFKQLTSVIFLSFQLIAVYQFKSARMVSCWNLYSLCVCSWAVTCQYSCC